MTSSKHELIARAARANGGFFLRAEAADAGFSASAVSRQLSRGLWTEPMPGILAPAGLPIGREVRERMVARWLGRTARLSHLTAARAYGLPVPDDDHVWITVGASVRIAPQSGLIVTRTRHLPGAVARQGLLLTPPARTLVDLAQVLAQTDLTAALMRGLQLRLCSLDSVVSLSRLFRTRAGAADLAAVLRVLSPEFESYLEAVLGGGLAQAGLTRLRPQYKIYDGAGHLVARTDLADLVTKTAIEADGFACHGMPEQRTRDERRDRTLARLGWLTVRCGTYDIMRNLAETVADIIAVVQQRESR